MLKQPELFLNGHHLSVFTLPEEVEQFVRAEKWDHLDQTFQNLCRPDGRLYNFLQNYHSFSSVEFIISIRDAKNEWEEDGIWHDDGSRVFAFSLSLSLDSEKIKGGVLGVRRKGLIEMDLIATPSYGEIILFLTGVHGFEHRIHQVLEGKRIIIAGWCS